jgi:hypothetical protein
LGGPTERLPNYRVLLHFLTVLLAKAQAKTEWEPDWLAEQLALILQWYWGDEETPGYFRGVTPKYREPIAEVLQESATCAGLLVALAGAGEVARENELPETRERLASVARRLLTDPPLTWPKGVVDEAMRASGVMTASPPESEDGLEADVQATLDWEPRSAFLQRQAQRYGVETYECYFEERSLRHWEGERLIDGPVPSLAVEGVNDWSLARIGETLADFMRFHASSCYAIRLLKPDRRDAATLIYQTGHPANCLVRDHSTGKASVVPEAQPAQKPWDAPLRELFSTAA